MQIDNFPPLPVPLRVIKGRRPIGTKLIGHVHTEGTQNVRAQGCTAAVHSQNHNNRASLRRARCYQGCSPGHLSKQRGGRDHRVVHSGRSPLYSPDRAELMNFNGLNHLRKLAYRQSVHAARHTLEPAREGVGCLMEEKVSFRALARAPLWQRRAMSRPTSCRPELELCVELLAACSKAATC